MMHTRQLSEGSVRRLNAELALTQIEAINDFNKATAVLSKKLLNWTIAIVVMTFIMLCATGASAWFTYRSLVIVSETQKSK